MGLDQAVHAAFKQQSPHTRHWGATVVICFNFAGFDPKQIGIHATFLTLLTSRTCHEGTHPRHVSVSACCRACCGPFLFAPIQIKCARCSQLSAEYILAPVQERQHDVSCSRLALVGHSLHRHASTNNTRLRTWITFSHHASLAKHTSSGGVAPPIASKVTDGRLLPLRKLGAGSRGGVPCSSTRREGLAHAS